jgi:hypothetical protein
MSPAFNLKEIVYNMNKKYLTRVCIPASPYWKHFFLSAPILTPWNWFHLQAATARRAEMDYYSLILLEP